METAIGPRSVSLSSDLFDIRFDIEGRQDVPQISSNYALWIALPIAMATGRNLHINGLVSPDALQNASALISIWSKWTPELFSAVTVSAAETGRSPLPENRDAELMLFSGGLDSTYSLVKNYIATGKPVSLLTVHGMDYKAEDIQRFDELKKKIKPLTSKISGSHYCIRSNAAQVMSRFGIQGDIGHGFHLFGNLFLFEDKYKVGVIAADCSFASEFVMSPWGTNHVSNPFFASADFHVRTLDNDLDRSQKAGGLQQLAGGAAALQSVSFCKDYKSRPHNCGVCSKCVRTKAMFYTETGEIPPVFLDSQFSPRDVGIIDVTKRGERTFVLDLLSSARRNSKEKEFSWLADEVAKPGGKAKPSKKWRKLFK